MVSDFDATVIGAMIVAPLVTPILGTALAVVVADRRRLLASVARVLGGAVVVVVIGYLVGLLTPEPIVAASNSQVPGRVDPTLIDLVAALATGAAGAFALVRADVSDTLPGMAIATSLVPPLAVSGAPDQAWAPRSCSPRSSRPERWCCWPTGSARAPSRRGGRSASSEHSR